MKIAILGGGGAMGGLFGGYLARSGEDVVLVDVSQASVDAINRNGLAIEEKDGSTATLRVKASSEPSDIGPADLIVNFVKCYNTEAAITAAGPMLGASTAILTLQNGWGNADRIAAVAGRSRVMVGLTYHSGTLLGPGRVKHSGNGITHVGELDGSQSGRLDHTGHPTRSRVVAESARRVNRCGGVSSNAIVIAAWPPRDTWPAGSSPARPLRH